MARMIQGGPCGFIQWLKLLLRTDAFAGGPGIQSSLNMNGSRSVIRFPISIDGDSYE